MARKVAKKSSAKKTAKKKSTTKKASARKSTAKKTAKKKPAAKKKAAKKTTAKKTAAKKSTRKPVAKKKAAKKPAAKKVVKKAAPKKAVVAKPAPKKARVATKPKNAGTMSYTQSEFIENLQAFCGLEKKKEAKEIWEDIQLFLTDSLKRGYRVPLVGLGKMYVRKTKARMGRNPATGEPIRIGAKKRVRFTAAKALKDAVL